MKKVYSLLGLGLALILQTTNSNAQCVQITCPSNLSVSVDSACGATVNYTLPNAINTCITSTSSFNYTGSIQTFTVPAGVTSIEIDARGAQGSNGFTGAGGLGARMTGTFAVTPGQVINILVGQQGLDNNISGSHNGKSTGGGGGSFVVSNSIPMIIAGGGGGTGNISQGMDATTDSAGVSPVNGCTGGVNGNGGQGNGSYNGGGSGGGYYTDGAAPGGDGGTTPNRFGKSYLNGGAGGDNGQHNGGGGYGGGAGGGNYGGGGGGGYSGGGGGNSNGYGGGGGGSLNTGTNQVNTAGFQSGNGEVIITIPGVLTPVLISGGASGSFFNAGTHTIEYYAIDGLGDSATCSFTITVNDDVEPTISAPSDMNVCDTLNGIVLLTGDNCSLSNQPTYAMSGATTGSGTGNANGVAVNAGTTQIIYTLSDNAGNTNSDTLVVTYTPANVSANASDSIMCVNHAQVSLTGLPTGGSWSGAGVTGTTFDPSAAGAGTHIVQYSYTDGNSCNYTATDNVVVLPCLNLSEPGENTITMFPNPADEFVNISLQLDGENTVNIIDMNGKIVLTKIVKAGMNQLDVTNLSSGIYTLEMNGSHQRLIVAH